MRARTRKAAAASVLVAAAIGFFFLRRAQAPVPSGTARPGARVHWPEGKRLLFDVAWRGSTGGEIAPGPDGKNSKSLAMEAAAAGEIALERAAGGPGRAQVALSWTRIDKLSFSMEGEEAGGELAEARKSLPGQTAFLDIDDRGRIGAIAFPTEMTPAARAILRSLALELRYTLPESESQEWTAVEQDSLGELELRYRAGTVSMVREPVAYRRLDAVAGELSGKQRVQGGAVISLDADGVPLSIEETTGGAYTRPSGSSPAVESSWMFMLRRTGEAPARPGLAALFARSQGQPLARQVDDPDREPRRDRQLAAKMTFNQLLLTIDRFETGTRPDHQYLIRAAAWLRVHPGDLPYMVTRFKAQELTVKGRGLILDVLVQTGTPAAQQAMRDALSSAAAHAGSPRDFSILVQRFSFVMAPEKASVEFLEQQYGEASHAARLAEAQGTAVALGSAVRRLDDQNNHALAREVNERLRDDLHRAASPEMRGALVAALGNAARPEDVSDLVAVAGDADVRVRNQVADALRSVDSPQARAGLISLAADPSSAVAIKAFDSLRKQSLEGSDWQALAGLARSGRTPAASDPALVALIRDKGASRAEGREILGQLLRRNQSPDSDLPVIIRGLLTDHGG